MNSESTSFIV